MLPTEHAVALTDESSPAYLPGLFQITLGTALDSPKITEAARTGAGIGRHDHGQDVFDGCERFLPPAYNASLVSTWLPALDGSPPSSAAARRWQTSAAATARRRS